MNLDYGAFHHVVGNLYILSKLSQQKVSHHITLAEGSKARVTGIDQATTLPSLSLNSVQFALNSLFN